MTLNYKRSGVGNQEYNSEIIEKFLINITDQIHNFHEGIKSWIETIFCCVDLKWNTSKLELVKYELFM